MITDSPKVFERQLTYYATKGKTVIRDQLITQQLYKCGTESWSVIHYVN